MEYLNAAMLWNESNAGSSSPDELERGWFLDTPQDQIDMPAIPPSLPLVARVELAAAAA